MKLEASSVRLRLVEESDAEFILKLRLDDKYNRYISYVSDDLEEQKTWIRKYKDDEKNKKQFYFIIERLDGIPCGTVRIYDMTDEHFVLGSWILNEDKLRLAMPESAILVSNFGFNVLGYKKYRFDTMKKNNTTVAFFKKIGAKIIDENEFENFYEITKNDCQKAFDKLWSRLIK